MELQQFIEKYEALQATDMAELDNVLTCMRVYINNNGGNPPTELMNYRILQEQRHMLNATIATRDAMLKDLKKLKQ